MRLATSFPEFADAPREIAGKKVGLRLWNDRDLRLLAAAFAVADVAASMRPPVPIGLRGARQWIDARRSMPHRGRGASYAVTVNGTDEAVGSVELRARSGIQRAMEVGYWLMPDVRRRGVGREAVGLACDWAFEHGKADSVVAVIDATNVGSQRLVEGLGFERRERLDSNDGWIGDWLLYQRFRD